MHKRILIVDDEPALLDMMREMLKRYDHELEVDITENGNTALSHLKKSGTDLLISDIFMPEKEGIELIREVKQKYPAIKIIAMSGGLNRQGINYLEMAKLLGSTTTLPKPFSREELLSAVQGLLNNGELANSKK
jgi:DNA-binding NtrC family response regulator